MSSAVQDRPAPVDRRWLVLVALLRGAEGRVRFRIIRGLEIVLVVAVIMLVLAVTGGFTHAVTA